jgi:hypothetical protein
VFTRVPALCSVLQSCSTGCRTETHAQATVGRSCWSDARSVRTAACAERSPDPARIRKHMDVAAAVPAPRCPRSNRANEHALDAESIQLGRKLCEACSQHARLRAANSRARAAAAKASAASTDTPALEPNYRAVPALAPLAIVTSATQTASQPIASGSSVPAQVQRRPRPLFVRPGSSDDDDNADDSALGLVIATFETRSSLLRALANACDAPTSFDFGGSYSVPDDELAHLGSEDDEGERTFMRDSLRAICNVSRYRFTCAPSRPWARSERISSKGFRSRSYGLSLSGLCSQSSHLHRERSYVNAEASESGGTDHPQQPGQAATVRNAAI